MLPRTTHNTKLMSSVTDFYVAIGNEKEIRLLDTVLNKLIVRFMNYATTSRAGTSGFSC